MGYCVSMMECDFHIFSENMPKALQAVRNLTPKSVGMSRFSWVSVEEYEDAKTLKDAMYAWRWDVEENDKGIWSIYFEGEKLGDDLVLFQAIAPWVKDGSYIQMMGEDNYLWRWVFNRGKCKEVDPEILWP